MPDLDPTHEHCGRIVIDYYDPGDGHSYPVVTIDPVGRIVPNALDRHLGTIYREIQTAQSLVRNGVTPPVPSRRKGLRNAA
jgi:hypothetical protein